MNLLLLGLGVLMLAGALMVVFSKNTVTSALFLVLVCFSVALFEGLLGAHFLAALQVLLYAGAIMVLFVFVIMLINPEWRETRPEWWSRRRMGLPLFCLMLLVPGVWHVFTRIHPPASLLFPVGSQTEAAIEQRGGNVWVLSKVLFQEWLLPVELVSLILLSVIVGVVQVSKRGLRREQKNIEGTESWKRHSGLS
jgi:NADH-quinone oxidoreductase subunit J